MKKNKNLNEIRLQPGDIFDTPYESGCVVVTAPETDGFMAGYFDALDSDGVLCSFSIVMVSSVKEES